MHCSKFGKRKINTARLQRFKMQNEQYIGLCVLPVVFVLWQILPECVALLAGEDTYETFFSMDYALVNMLLKGIFFGGLVIAVNNCSKKVICIYLLPYIIFYCGYFIINIQTQYWADMSLAVFNLIGIFNVMLFIIVMKMFVLVKKRKKIVVTIYYYVTAIILTLIYDFIHLMFYLIAYYTIRDIPVRSFDVPSIFGTVIGCTIGYLMVNENKTATKK